MQVGPVPVKVYSAPSRKRGVTYAGYVASFLMEGERHRVQASSIEKLEAKVKDMIRPLVGENDTLTLRGSRLRAYERATQIAAELGLELDEALQRLSAIQKLTKTKNCSIEQAVDYWARHHDESKFSTPVQSVATAFLEACKQNGNSKEDIDTMKGKLKRFATAFACPLCDVSADQYREYFADITGSPRNKMNHRNTVRRLVNWAKDIGYLAIDHPGLPRFAGKVKRVPKRVEVYTRNEREQLIEKADPIELPMTLIKAYTPIRAKECGLARWESIDWDLRILNVWADDAKKREPRAIHLPRELCERLRPLALENGRIYPYQSCYKVGPRLAKRAGLKWIRNGWRTTTISHLQAAIIDAPRVAEEAGTSVRKIKTNYLKLLSPHDGRVYFGLRQGERHPVEPGYNAEHYGLDPVVPVDHSDNIISPHFGAQCA
jgi:integrase